MQNKELNYLNLKCDSSNLKYKIKLISSYEVYDESNISQGKKYKNFTYDYNLPISKMPYIHSYFNQALLLDNSGNLMDMDKYKRYPFLYQAMAGVRKSGQWWVRSSSFEYYFREKNEFEMRVNHYKTISVAIIDSFSFISIIYLRKAIFLHKTAY